MTRKRDLRQRARSEHSDLEHLGTRSRFRTRRQAASIGDTHDARRRRLGDVVDAEKINKLDFGADLFHALAHCGIGGML
ncbi:MAG TPA: hypothetical protein VHQ03_04975, partial [Candidatus Dormibacteraeota bacterium]|nr:hypothetical protein [Candidatus Dormibacteraeota bacterium]